MITLIFKGPILFVRYCRGLSDGFKREKDDLVVRCANVNMNYCQKIRNSGFSFVEALWPISWIWFRLPFILTSHSGSTFTCRQVQVVSLAQIRWILISIMFTLLIFLLVVSRWVSVLQVASYSSCHFSFPLLHSDSLARTYQNIRSFQIHIWFSYNILGHHNLFIEIIFLSDFLIRILL